MWVPLVVLAILATIGGMVGISTAFTGGKEIGGKLNIVTWMNPVIWNPVSKQFGTEVSAKSDDLNTTSSEESLARKVESEKAHGQTGFNLAETVEAKLGSETAAEWLF